METHTTRSRKKSMMGAIWSWGRPVLLLVLGASLLAAPGGCPKRPEVATPAPVAVAPPPPPPAPPAPVVRAPAPDVKVLFDFDKADIRSGDRQALDQAIKWLKDNPGTKISLNGFADERGTAPYNLKLSQRRADAVRSYLVAGGVDPGRITATGRGATRQFAAGNNEAAWQLNRRVDLAVAQ